MTILLAFPSLSLVCVLRRSRLLSLGFRDLRYSTKIKNQQSSSSSASASTSSLTFFLLVVDRDENLLLLLPFSQLASHHTCRYTFDSCFHLPDHLPDQLLVVLLLVLLLRRDLTELRDDDEVLLLRKGLLRHRPHM